MASMVLKDAFFSLGGTDLSTYIKSITFSGTADTPEDTAMGDDSKSYLPGGLRDWTVALEFNHDDAVGAVSATLWTAYTSAAVSAVVARPASGAKSTTNPEYTGNVVVSDVTPFGGSVGDAGSNSLSLQGSGGLTRDAS